MKLKVFKGYKMNTEHIIINGDSRLMNDLEDNSVHLVVTSPPYWQLKDYGDKNQIGFYDSYESYINNLNLVWNECYRVLHDGCRLCINIGDQFARAVYYGRYKIMPIRTEIIKFCEEIGFDYMGAIIWQKVTSTNTTGGASIMGSFPYPRNGILKLDYEFILIFKKPGEGPKVSKEIKEASIIDKDDWNKYFQGHWNFPGEKQTNHIAMFPEELPGRLIKMFTFVGETVLDPFLGSGTTSLAALKLGRNSVGYEINSNFIEIIKNKLYPIKESLFEEHNIIFKKQTLHDFNPAEKIKGLRYVFKDPHAFNKKIDPRKITFGNKITGDEKKSNSGYSIKEIINVDTIKLDNDIIIKLLGVKPKRNYEEGINYLKSLTKGKKIFLEFDGEKFDKNGNLLCYAFLSNKTFINTNLLSKGLADVDLSIKHSKEKIFNKYRGNYE
jgi:site-specific DNA-methyltransferase (adenine-specific)